MKTIKIKRLHKDAKIPTMGTPDSGCFDLYALDCGELRISDDGICSRVYKLGFALELPKGYDALIFPRSSIRDKSLIFANSVGYIDNDYRGECMVTFKDDVSQNPEISAKGLYQPGDRIAQLRLIEKIPTRFEEVEELSDTQRGTGGFGSTGK